MTRSSVCKHQLYTPKPPTVISMTTYTYENTRYVHHANQISRKMIVLLMYQMTEPCIRENTWLSVYKPNTKFPCRPSLLARPSKSKQEDWMHTFSSTTPGLGVENNLDYVWGYTLSLVDQIGSMPHLSCSIHTKCTSTTGLSFTTHWVKTDP